MSTSARELFRLRSFVRRDSRLTRAQERAHASEWPRYGLTLGETPLDFQQVFLRSAPCYLEIGFGSGTSLLAAAKAMPECNFIGVETHKPGVGALLLGIHQEALTNLRIFNIDVIDVLEKGIPDHSLSGVQLFFPDPWQKRRHHLRRLIQPAFVRTLVMKLIPGGSLHLATDWEDYAKHMMQVLSNEKSLINVAGEGAYASRSPFRPIVTKFEKRAEREGRNVRELQFKKSLDIKLSLT